MASFYQVFFFLLKFLFFNFLPPPPLLLSRPFSLLIWEIRGWDLKWMLVDLLSPSSISFLQWSRMNPGPLCAILGLTMLQCQKLHFESKMAKKIANFFFERLTNGISRKSERHCLPISCTSALNTKTRTTVHEETLKFEISTLQSRWLQSRFALKPAQGP